jgi:hypothetical protein
MYNKFEGICNKTAVTHFKTVSRHLREESGKYSRIPLIRTLVIRIADHLDRLGPSSKFVEDCTKLIWVEVTSYGIKYSVELWLVESGVVERFRCTHILLMVIADLSGLTVAWWPYVPKFACSNPTKAASDFSGQKKNPQHAFLREGK